LAIQSGMARLLVTLASGAKCMTTEPSDLVFRHACKMGLEGIVSKRIGSPDRG
jgi:ATP-dependent DNA ligase